MLAPRQHVAVLERLAPRIERTHALTPESREAILQLVERVRHAGGDPRQHERREHAIQRVIGMMEARERTSSVGRGAGK
jgi:hypothetical protein